MDAQSVDKVIALRVFFVFDFFFSSYATNDISPSLLYTNKYRFLALIATQLKKCFYFYRVERCIYNFISLVSEGSYIGKASIWYFQKSQF